MPKRAKIYIGAVILGGIFVAIGTWLNHQSLDWSPLIFVVLALLAALVNTSKFLGPSYESWRINPVFLFAGLLTLPFPFYVILAVIPVAVDAISDWWRHGRTNRSWYMYPFHGAIYIIAGAVALWAYGLLVGESKALTSAGGLAGAILAAFIFVSIDRLLINQALSLFQFTSWQTYNLLDWVDSETFFTDLTFPILGFVVAVLIEINLWLILPALILIMLINRSATVPQLRKEAQTDPKTGLFNARYWRTLVFAELERARRFKRPLSLIMADLDLLRTINNVYGHLAGDVVLRGIADIIVEESRDYDIAGRFGGEEFAIVLPEVGTGEARAMAERLRRAVEEKEFYVSTNLTPVRATMSFGISSYPQDGETLDSLIHTADLALYQAKLNGRNRVAIAGDIPYSLDLDIPHLRHNVLTENLYHEAPTEPNAERRASATETSSMPAGAEEDTESTPHNTYALTLLWLATVGIATLLAVAGLWSEPFRNLEALVLFLMLAILAEVFNLDIYGRSTVSVAIAFLIGAAMVCGMPGVVLIGSAMALGEYVVRNTQLHRITFRWAIHILAGTAVVVLMGRSGLFHEDGSNVPLMTISMLAVAFLIFMLETGLSALYDALLTGEENSFSAWQAQYGWLTLHYLLLGVAGLFLALAYVQMGISGVLIFSAPVSLLYLSQRQYLERTKSSVIEQRRMNMELTYANREVLAASQAIRQLNEELFITLSKIIDARDPDVHGHAQRVAGYAEAIARQMGLGDEQAQNIRQAALLHDIGKIGIPERILHKPAPLTNQEYEIIKSHTTLGGDLLETSQGLRHLSPYVRHHHEWWDGSGYPKGLCGEQIPLAARILAVCDAAEAMASTRPYQRALPLEQVVQELRNGAGTQFDPDVVKAFIFLAETQSPWLVEQPAITEMQW